MQKYQNWMSEGTMEAPARCGAKEKVPTVSSAPSATASAPARLRAVRLFMGRLFMGRLFMGRLFMGRRFTGALGNPPVIVTFAFASWRYEPGNRARAARP